MVVTGQKTVVEQLCINVALGARAVRLGRCGSAVCRLVGRAGTSGPLQLRVQGSGGFGGCRRSVAVAMCVGVVVASVQDAYDGRPAHGMSRSPIPSKRWSRRSLGFAFVRHRQGQLSATVWGRHHGVGRLHSCEASWMTSSWSATI